ncbi:ferredoxin-NADP reductase [Bradyrhizobium diazoefficiens]
MVGLTLRPVDGGSLPAFRPGQYVSVRMGGAIRSYSLTGAAVASPEAYDIGVRHIAGGRVSTAIRHALAPGDVVELQSPKGGFVLPLRNEFPVVLIAGGIGITPFLSYLETLEGTSDEPRVTLHYGCRDNGKRRSRPIRKGLAWGLQSVDQRVCKSLAGGMEAATTENYEVRPNDQGRSSSIRDCG